MYRVSTNATLFFKFFIPVIWIVFFGAFTITALSLRYSYVANIPAATFRIAVVVFYLGGIAFLYWAFLRLKRVEMDEHFVYVTNYFKTFRYPYHNVERLTYNNYLIGRSATLHLREPGQFGSKMTFIPSRSNFAQFLDEYPNIKRHLLKS